MNLPNETVEKTLVRKTFNGKHYACGRAWMAPWRHRDIDRGLLMGWSLRTLYWADFLEDHSLMDWSLGTIHPVMVLLTQLIS